MVDDPGKPLETPRVEPEILPPQRGGSPPRGEAWNKPVNDAWPPWESQGTRIHVARIGPFKLFLWAFAVLLVAASVLLLFAGALLIVLPVAAAVIAGSIVVARLRRTFRR